MRQLNIECPCCHLKTNNHHAFKVIKTAPYPNNHMDMVCCPVCGTLFVAMYSIDSYIMDTREIASLNEDLGTNYQGSKFNRDYVPLSLEEMVAKEEELRCPTCGNDSCMTLLDTFHDPRGNLDKYHCEDCGTTFTAVYTLTDILIEGNK